MRYLFVVLTSLALSASSGCDDDDDCTAGTGGNLTLVVTPQHHGVTIPNQDYYRDTVMVKFNTQEFPGANPSSYDLIVVGDSAENHIHVEGLTCGDYYIYAVGLDTSSMERVTGGKPFSTDQTSGEISVFVPVTE
jgi:hypothetical protein